MRSGRAALFGAILVLMSSLSVSPGANAQPLTHNDWAMRLFDVGNSGYNPYEHDIGPKNVHRLKLTWFSQGFSQIASTPAVVDGLLFELDCRAFYSLWADTGSPDWNRYLETCSTSSPSVANGIVYVCNYFAYAVYASTGFGVWTKKLNGGCYSSPIVAKGTVYLTSDDGYLYALSAVSGRKRWKYGPVDRDEPAAFARGVVYVGATAVDGKTGNVLWNHGGGSEAVVDGVDYVAAISGLVVAYDATTGRKLWSHQLPSGSWSSPSVANDVLYQGSETGGVYALDAGTGKSLWSYQAAGPVWATPTVANGVVYFESSEFSEPFSPGSQGARPRNPAYEANLYALDAVSGKLLWSYAGAGGEASPVIVGGVVYTGSETMSSEAVYAFDLP
jgi:outer membrane protein assembly factor BamB